MPLRWEPDPETVVPNAGGKIWLIIQNHGDADYFPHGSPGAYQRALDERLGRPRATTRFQLAPRRDLVDL